MVLAVYTAVTCVRQETELQTLRRAKAEIVEKISRETRINEQLAERKLEIASGDAIERLAREKLGYVKDGERIFVDSNKYGAGKKLPALFQKPMASLAIGFWNL